MISNSQPNASKPAPHALPFSGAFESDDGEAVFSYNYDETMFARLEAAASAYGVRSLSTEVELFGFVEKGADDNDGRGDPSGARDRIEFWVVWKNTDGFGSAPCSLDRSGAFVLGTDRQEIVAAVLMVLVQETGGMLRIKAKEPAPQEVLLELEDGSALLEPLLEADTAVIKPPPMGTLLRTPSAPAPSPTRFIVPKHISLAEIRRVEVLPPSNSDGTHVAGFDSRKVALFVGVLLLFGLGLGYFLLSLERPSLPSIAGPAIRVPSVTVAGIDIDPVLPVGDLYLAHPTAIPAKKTVAVAKPAPRDRVASQELPPEPTPARPPEPDPARLVARSSNSAGVEVFGLPVATSAPVEPVVREDVSPAPASGGYQIVSIPTSEMVLVSQMRGQVMRVTPYPVGAKLPDGRTITAADVQSGVVLTDRGSIQVGS